LVGGSVALLCCRACFCWLPSPGRNPGGSPVAGATARSYRGAPRSTVLASRCQRVGSIWRRGCGGFLRICGSRLAPRARPMSAYEGRAVAPQVCQGARTRDSAVPARPCRRGGRVSLPAEYAPYCERGWQERADRGPQPGAKRPWFGCCTRIACRSQPPVTALQRGCNPSC